MIDASLLGKLIALLVGLFAISLITGIMKSEKRISLVEFTIIVIIGFVLSYGFYNVFGELTGWWEPITPQMFLQSIMKRLPEFSLIAFLKALAGHLPILSNLIG